MKQNDITSSNICFAEMCARVSGDFITFGYTSSVSTHMINGRACSSARDFWLICGNLFRPWLRWLCRDFELTHDFAFEFEVSKSHLADCRLNSQECIENTLTLGWWSVLQMCRGKRLWKEGLSKFSVEVYWLSCTTKQRIYSQPQMLRILSEELHLHAVRRKMSTALPFDNNLKKQYVNYYVPRPSRSS